LLETGLAKNPVSGLAKNLVSAGPNYCLLPIASCLLPSEKRSLFLNSSNNLKNKFKAELSS
jgi:hypothetical protein